MLDILKQIVGRMKHSKIKQSYLEESGLVCVLLPPS